MPINGFAAFNPNGLDITVIFFEDILLSIEGALICILGAVVMFFPNGLLDLLLVEAVAVGFSYYFQVTLAAFISIMTKKTGFGVWGLGFGVWGLGFGVWGLEIGRAHV